MVVFNMMSKLYVKELLRKILRHWNGGGNYLSHVGLYEGAFCFGGFFLLLLVANILVCLSWDHWTILTTTQCVCNFKLEILLILKVSPVTSSKSDLPPQMFSSAWSCLQVVKLPPDPPFRFAPKLFIVWSHRLLGSSHSHCFHRRASSSHRRLIE